MRTVICILWSKRIYASRQIILYYYKSIISIIPLDYLSYWVFGLNIYGFHPTKLWSKINMILFSRQKCMNTNDNSIHVCRSLCTFRCYFRQKNYCDLIHVLDSCVHYICLKKKHNCLLLTIYVYILVNIIFLIYTGLGANNRIV